MGTITIGAHTGKVVIGGGGIGVTVVSEGVREAVAALVYVAGGVLTMLIYIGDLVVAVAAVLTSRHEGRTVVCQVGAHIDHGAGRRTDCANQ